VGLPNLIVDRLVIRELLQEELSESNLTEELGRLLNDDAYRARIASDYADLRHALGDEGASRRTAALMLARLRK
jgi:lipid-A-disaccharide synthase